ncbi:MAG TPA: hypothetical protein VD905_09970, partial [Flavobacteriales bacterium]|nr:hypothetical protein [Flavobacteriales bacterium]
MQIKKWIVDRRKAVLHMLLLVAVFAVSVGVRYKHFGKPLSRHHEWLTAHSLIIMKIWDKGGIANYHFAPVYSFPGKGNKHDYSICSLHDRQGDAYYVSYGPFSSIFPYFLFKLFMMPVTIGTLIGFNLLVHFLVSLFLYLLVSRLAGKRVSDFSLGALVAFKLYLFSPGTLWFHGNVYFSEILVQLFFAAGMYVFYLLLEQKAQNRKLLIWYGLICFFGIYTEWLGLFFTFVTGVFFLVKTIRERAYLRPFLIAACSGILALSLIIYQYSSIAGWDQFVKVETNKFVERNGGMVNGYKAEEKFSITNAESFKILEAELNGNFLNVMNTLAFVIPLFVVLVCYRKKYLFNGKQGVILGIMALVVLMHHLVFFNFTAVHDFSMLKTGYVLIFLVAIMISRMEEFSVGRAWLRWTFLLLVMGFMVVKAVGSWKIYDKDRGPKFVYATYKVAGTQIKQHARPDKEIVLTNI